MLATNLPNPYPRPMHKLLMLPVTALALVALSACSDDAMRSASPARDVSAPNTQNSPTTGTPLNTETSPSSSAEPSNSASPAGGFWIDGTRLCVKNETNNTTTAKARDPQEQSDSGKLTPGATYCAAGYQEGSPSREKGDIVIDVQASGSNGASANLVLVGNNQTGISGVQAWTLEGPIPRHMVVSSDGLSVGQSINGTTSDGSFNVRMERVADCCGWKQLRVVVSQN